MNRPEPLPPVHSVFQLNEKATMPGAVGAFVLATEVRSWGIQGFIHAIQPGAEHMSCIYIRPTWEQLEYVGRATLVPDPERSETE